MYEAGFSETIKLFNDSGAERMVTFRGESYEEWGKVEAEIGKYLDEKKKAGWLLTRPSAPRPQSQQPQQADAQQQPAQQPRPQQAAQPQTGGAQLTFHATKFSVQFHPSGKKIGKFHGGKFQKYGVTAWPEVAGPLGFDVETLNPGEYACDLEVAYTVNAEDKPQKVTGQDCARHQQHGFGQNDGEVPY
jgi:hypothetical protein